MIIVIFVIMIKGGIIVVTTKHTKYMYMYIHTYLREWGNSVWRWEDGCFSNSQGWRFGFMMFDTALKSEGCHMLDEWKSRGDYILRSDDVLAVIEAKRCSSNWVWTLSQGVAQCIWQLAILRESQPLERDLWGFGRWAAAWETSLSLGGSSRLTQV